MKNPELRERIKRMATALSGVILLISTLGAFIQFFYAKEPSSGVNPYMKKFATGIVLIAVIWICYFLYVWISHRQEKKND